MHLHVRYNTSDVLTYLVQCIFRTMYICYSTRRHCSHVHFNGMNMQQYEIVDFTCYTFLHVIHSLITNERFAGIYSNLDEFVLQSHVVSSLPLHADQIEHMVPNVKGVA